MTYHPVTKGERVVVSIYGKNFSSQIGILVNGVPLTQELGVAQPFIRDDSLVADRVAEAIKKEKVVGRIERIDTTQLIASFEMLDGKEGTPVITVVAPGKARDLNSLRLYINGKPNTTLNEADLMFGVRPKIKIDKVEIFRNSSKPGELIALIGGKGFNSTTQKVFINGIEKTNIVTSKTLMRVEFPAPSDEAIQVTLIDGDDPPVRSQLVANPVHLRISNVSVVSYEPGGKRSPGVLVVKIIGVGFTDKLEIKGGKRGDDLIVQSLTEAILKLTDPDAAEVITLRDKATGAEVKAIVTRRPAP